MERFISRHFIKYGFFLTATSSKNDQTGLTFDQRGEYLLKSPGTRNITGPVDTFYVYIYQFPSREIAQSILNNTTTLDQNIRVYLLRIEKMSVNVYETIQGINYYDDRRLYRDCPSLNFKSGDIIIKKGWHDAATSLTCMSCNKKINPNGKDSAIVSQSACSKMIKYDEYNTQCHVKVNDGGKVGYNKKYFTFTGSDSVKRCFQCSSSEYTGFGLLIGPVDMNYCQSIYHGP